MSSWCDLLVARADRVRLAGAADRRAARAPPLYALPPHAREVGRDRGVVGGTCRAGAAARRARRRAARRARPRPARLGGRPGRGARRVGARAGATPPACAARSARGPAGRRSSTGSATCSPSASPEAGTPPALDLVEAAHALPDAVLGRAHRGGADARDRRAARDRRRLVGDPRARPQGAARHADGAHRARRLRARGLPRRRAQRRLAGRALHRHAARPRAGARGLRGRRRRLPGHRRERLLGDGPRHRPGARSSCSTTACASRAQPVPPPATRTRRLGRADRPAQGHPHAAARRGRDAAARARTRASRTTARSPTARRPTGARATALHARLGLGDRFRFMGRTTDPNGVVRDADVVLMTSISEGLPMSVLEAMSEGRPVVSHRRRRRPGRGQGLRRGHAARATTTGSRWRW